MFWSVGDAKVRILFVTVLIVALLVALINLSLAPIVAER